ncbi:hypothetical protein EDB83DRAFT_2314658 [Lactarius deliciosus]|nr:hypothetical protein EDB83DRAFT_2314658 [Lactarius deliciosus]
MRGLTNHKHITGTLSQMGTALKAIQNPNFKVQFLYHLLRSMHRGTCKVELCKGHTWHYETNVSMLQSLVKLEQRVAAQTRAMKQLKCGLTPPASPNKCRLVIDIKKPGHSGPLNLALKQLQAEVIAG